MFRLHASAYARDDRVGESCMCGVCGILNLRGEFAANESALRRMVAAQRHRGPDDEGYLCGPGASLGFCRLAIIDLSPAGHQPMCNEDESVWLVFNGEIYNYRELVPELERRGHRFRSHSDSEVILHGYEEWGVDCVQRFNGMFAFAIWDRNQRRVVLARDRLGVKPLYYWSDGVSFAFASELKALLQAPGVQRQVSPSALHTYLEYEYVPSPESIFEGIQKLPPAYTLVVPLDGRAEGLATSAWQPKPYWNVQFNQGAAPARRVDEYADELYHLLKAAVQRRLISDVPLGAFLSGGIDSTSVVALMAELSDEPVKTFTIRFDEASYSESRYAAAVARRFGTDHHVETLRPDTLELISSIADVLDEPFADASALPTYLVSRAARKNVTVALTGDGGDELFAGYDWYRAQQFTGMTLDHLPAPMFRWLTSLTAQLPHSDKKKAMRDIAFRLMQGASLPPALQHVRWQMFWGDDELEALLVDPASAFTKVADPRIVALLAGSGSQRPLDQQQYTDIKRYLPDDILFKVDRMSMAVSLETRGPFLDYTLHEFAARLPPSLRLRGGVTKYLLRRAMRNRIPDETLTRSKLGFNIPYKIWLRTDLRELLQDMLAPSRLSQQGYFEPKYVQRLVAEHLIGTHNHAHKLWQLLMFQLWADRYLSGPQPDEHEAGTAPTVLSAPVESR